MKNSKKEIPHFETETAENEFWMAEDSTNYFDWNSAQIAKFPNLKPITGSIATDIKTQQLQLIQIITQDFGI